jgi:hypothetical protein
MFVTLNEVKGTMYGHGPLRFAQGDKCDECTVAQGGRSFGDGVTSSRRASSSTRSATASW